MSNLKKVKLSLLLLFGLGWTSVQAQTTASATVKPFDLNVGSIWKKKNPQPDSTSKPKPQDDAPVEEVKPEFTLEGYVDAYYNISSDSNAYVGDGIQRFTTVAPRVNQFGLNVVRLKAAYTSKLIRGNISLFWGDIPKYSWSQEASPGFLGHYNNIQEANIGVRLTKGLWLDMGFFCTHVGGEVLLPKDNLMSSLSFVTYHEPFFMSGATLTWDPNPIVTARLVLANDYYFFADPNRLSNKAVGLLLTVRPIENLAITYDNILLNMAPSGNDTTQFRFYNDINIVYNRKRLTLLAETDFGTQGNSKNNKTETAFFVNGLVAAKYRFVQKAAVFGRFEFFSDPDAAISAPILNKDGNTVSGLKATAFTFGGEINPTSNSYLRLEGRFTNADRNQEWFKTMSGNPTYQRLEAIFTFGVNFTTGNLMK